MPYLEHLHPALGPGRRGGDRGDVISNRLGSDSHGASWSIRWSRSRPTEVGHRHRGTWHPPTIRNSRNRRASTRSCSTRASMEHLVLMRATALSCLRGYRDPVQPAWSVAYKGQSAGCCGYRGRSNSRAFAISHYRCNRRLGRAGHRQPSPRGPGPTRGGLPFIRPQTTRTLLDAARSLTALPRRVPRARPHRGSPPGSQPWAAVDPAGEIRPTTYRPSPSGEGPRRDGRRRLRRSRPTPARPRTRRHSSPRSPTSGARTSGPAVSSDLRRGAS